MGMSSRTNPKVAVLMGGPSAEREVSLSSGRECAAALAGEGFEVVELDAGPDLYARLLDIKPDVVFNASAWPLGRGWLRAGAAGMDADSLHAFRCAGLGPWPWTSSAAKRSIRPKACRLFPA